MITILRDAGLSDSGRPSRAQAALRSGFQFTEGPLWCPDGSLLFQDIKAERTFRLVADGSLELLREQTQGRQRPDLASRRVRSSSASRTAAGSRGWTRTAPSVTTLAETWSGARLNSPNDVVCRSDGLVYFTDPPYGVEPSERSLHFQGVYALDLDRGGEAGLRLLADDFEKPNGLAFSPDERTLYVCDTARYHVRAFEVERSGALKPGSSRVFARLDPGQPGGPDGMKVDRAGGCMSRSRWASGSSSPTDGSSASCRCRLARPTWPGARPDGRRLAITAVDAVYEVELDVEGILPPFLP